MPKHVIIAVGGTGQMVLHYYTQLYLIGSVQEPFEAWVLDSAQLNGSLQTLSDFLGLVALAQGPSDSIASLKFRQIRPTAAATSVRQALTGHDRLHEFHPVSAFFDENTLSQNTTRGLYARPALSTVMALDESLFAQGVPNDSHVVVVGSVVGGTGGGLMAPLLGHIAKRVRETNAQGVSVRAVLFGDYFQPDINRMPDATARFQSNKILVCKTLAGLAPEILRSYILIDPERREPRNAEKETEGKQLPWPEDTHPLWSGVAALRDLLVDVVRPQQPDFFAREVHEGYLNLDRAACWDQLSKRYAVVEALVSKGAVEKMSREAFAKSVWSSLLPDLITAYWGAARQQMQVPDEHPRAFARQMSKRFAALWSQVRLVFPAIAYLPKPTVEMVRQTRWGLPPRQVAPGAFAESERAYRATAANVGFRALRG